MKCKNCSHRIIDTGHRLAHGPSKRSYVVYPKNKCHRSNCNCTKPELDMLGLENKEK